MSNSTIVIKGNELSIVILDPVADLDKVLLSHEWKTYRTEENWGVSPNSTKIFTDYECSRCGSKLTETMLGNYKMPNLQYNSCNEVIMIDLIK